jgi:hypothetical protein
MRKNLSLLLAALLLSSTLLYADKGKVRIAADKDGAYIYVDGKKKAMTGEGFTSILLEEGEYTIKVVKPADEIHEYMQSKKVFVSEDTSTKLKFKLKQTLTPKGKALQAKKDAKKLARWQRSGEVITDTKLGLMWQDNIETKNVRKKWKSAKKYCQNLTLVGYSDWRLPVYDELLSIVDYERYNPAIVPSFQNVSTTGYYWTSSVYASSAKRAWAVFVKHGGTYNFLETEDFHIRCVRDGQ